MPAESIETPAGQTALARAAEVLRCGGTVAFPTETVYGLGANALDAQAVGKIFLAKQRPSWDPLIVHVSSVSMLHRVAASVPAQARRLIDAFWPGPLTLLLPRLSAIPDAVTADRALVGVRMPLHPVALALIAAADVPVAAPSANRFGHTSPTTAQHVLDDLDGRIDLVLDGGPTTFGIESTVIEVGEQSIVLYRPGAVTVEEIEAIAGTVVRYRPPGNSESAATRASMPSPGVGIRHYAPNARVVLIDVGKGPEADQRERWMHAVRKHFSELGSEPGNSPSNVGVLLPMNWPLPKELSCVQYEWGCWQNDRELAQRLYAGLRALDVSKMERILCPLPGRSGLREAIEDRLRKAAREK